MIDNMTAMSKLVRSVTVAITRDSRELTRRPTADNQVFTCLWLSWVSTRKRAARVSRLHSGWRRPPEQQASAAGDYEAADKALNAAYAAVRVRLDDAGKTALRDEQRAWIKTRDESCGEAKIAAESGGDVAGGSAMALEVVGCKAKLTEARAKQLAAKG
ncbi:lysozyme inhibitor LprI family protein [Variovorax boronicumulans]